MNRLTYDYTLRSFGISSLSRLIPEASFLPEHHVLHGSGPNSVLDANASIINLGDARSAMQTMHKLLPFLGDKSSKTMFQSADEVVKVLWAHLENEEGLVKGKDVSRLQIGVSQTLISDLGQIKGIAQTILLLLQDVLILFAPKRVHVVDPDVVVATSAQTLLSRHVHSRVLLAISDIVVTFDALANPQVHCTPPPLPQARNGNSRPMDTRSARAAHKLRFYAAWLARTITSDDGQVQQLLRETEGRISVLEREIEVMNAQENPVGEIRVHE